MNLSTRGLTRTESAPMAAGTREVAEPTPSSGAEGKTAVVAASGELDLATGPALRREVERLFGKGQTKVVVDLDAVTFMDSSGVSALMEAFRSAEAIGASFSVMRPQSQVQQVLEITHADRLIPIVG